MVRNDFAQGLSGYFYWFYATWHMNTSILLFILSFINLCQFNKFSIAFFARGLAFSRFNVDIHSFSIGKICEKNGLNTLYRATIILRKTGGQLNA